ncbi:hypothetical protein ACFLQN_01210 [Candidatus Aenigmatarchaeota archaeon]
MRGITPIIAIILLLVIVIVVTASAFTIFQGVITSSGETAQTQVEHQSERLSKCLRIETVTADGIYVRNCGQGIVTDIKVYLGNEEIPSDNMNITEDGIAKINVSFGPHPGEGTNQLRVASSSATAFPRTVTISDLQTITLSWSDVPENDFIIEDGFVNNLFILDWFNTFFYIGHRDGNINRGFIDFDISQLPFNAVITEANISLRRHSFSGIDVVEVRNLPAKSDDFVTNEELYDTIALGEFYSEKPISEFPINAHINITLGNGANNNITQSISKGWFSLGFKTTGEADGNHYTPWSEDAENIGYTPRLVLTYYTIE